MIIRDGALLFSQPGMLPEKTLTELLGKVRAVDMDAVRREAEQAKASTQAPPAN